MPPSCPVAPGKRLSLSTEALTVPVRYLGMEAIEWKRMTLPGFAKGLSPLGPVRREWSLFARVLVSSLRSRETQELRITLARLF